MKRLFALIVALFAVVALVACAPANGAKAKAKMEKAGYACALVEGNDGAVLTGTKVLSGDLGFTATLYASAKDAREAYKATKNEDGKTVCQITGKWVFVGTESSWKAFK